MSNEKAMSILVLVELIKKIPTYHTNHTQSICSQ